MRLASATVLVLVLAFLAGCASDDGADEPEVEAPTPEAEVGTPEPLHFEGEVTVGADPSNFIPPAPVGTGEPCSLPTSTCFVHDFTVSEDQVGGNVSLTATLAWGVPANDLDLYLYQGGTQLSSDGINAIGTAEVPPTTQVLHHEGLAAGDYSFWVAVWNGAADAYTLDVVFEA